MRAPYYRVTAECRNYRCGTNRFEKTYKSVERKGTSGMVYTTKNVVCPQCRQWADVVEIEEIADG